MTSSAALTDVVEVPMVDIIHAPPSSSGRDDAEATGGHRITPDAASEKTPELDEPTVAVAAGAKHSKWGKLRQTVKATTMFASAVSGTAATSSGSVPSRGSRRKLISQADDRRDSFLKRFSTRQSSCGTSYFQAASFDGISTSNSNLEPDGKVRQNRHHSVRPVQLSSTRFYG